MSSIAVTGNASGTGTHTLQSANTNSNVTQTLPLTDGAILGYINAPINSQTGSTYTLVLTDQGNTVYITSGSTATLTVPTNASVTFPTGTVILVVNNNSGALTISGAGVTFQLANGATGNRTVATKGMATLLYVGSDTWYVSGAGVT
jgi:hypothetical protein